MSYKLPLVLTAGENQQLRGTDSLIDNINVFSVVNADVGGLTIPALKAVRWITAVFATTPQVSRAAAVTGFHKIVGFTIQSIAISTSGYVQRTGVLDGFSGLVEGERYYLASSPLGDIMPESAISLAGGEYLVPVGRAITSTKFLIRIGEPIQLA